jgi:hypothetical protein
LTNWCLVVLLTLSLTAAPLRGARAQTPDPLPYTEAARVEHLKAVAAAHQLTPSEARHQADTQLFVGALVLISSLLTPLIAEIRDEDFPALGSVLIGSIGLAVIIEGSLDEQDANRIRGQATIQEQIDRIGNDDQAPDNEPPPEDEDDDGRG